MKRSVILSLGMMCVLTMALLVPAASASTSVTWNYGFSLVGARAQSVVVQDDNELVYIIGGTATIGYSPVNNVNSYNPATGEWVSLAAMPFATRGACGGIGADDRIYVFGGTSSSTQIYDISTNSWSIGATMPTPVWEGKCAIMGDKAYVFGGENGWYEDLTQIYNMTTDSWSAGASMPEGVKAGAVVAKDGYAYYIGGENSTGAATSNVYRYDMVADSWSIVASLPMELCAEAAIIGPDGLIYVFGGADSAWNTGMGAVYSESFTYDISTNTWSSIADLNVARAWHGAAIVDGKVLAIGGNDPSNVFLSVESYDTLPSQLEKLQSKLNLLQSQLSQMDSELSGDISDLQDMIATLEDEIADLSASLNQTTDGLNNALDEADNAKAAADSANLMAMLGIVIGVIAVLIALVSLLMRPKKTTPVLMPQPPGPPSS